MCVKVQIQHLVLAVAKSEQCVMYFKHVCVLSCLSPTKLIRLTNSVPNVKLHNTESCHVVNISASKDSYYCIWPCYKLNFGQYPSPQARQPTFWRLSLPPNSAEIGREGPPVPGLLRADFNLQTPNKI